MADPKSWLTPEQHREQAGWLVGLAAGGDAAQAAAQALFKAYEKRTVGRLRRDFDLSTPEAEDIWQDTVLALLESAPRLGPVKNLVALFNTMANNRARNWTGKAWRRHDKSLDEDCGTGSSADGSLTNAELLSALDESVLALYEEAGHDADLRTLAYDCADERLERFKVEDPHRTRWLLARVGEKRPIPELAAELGCSETAMRSRLHLMKQQLTKFLQPCLDLLKQA